MLGIETIMMKKIGIILIVLLLHAISVSAQIKESSQNEELQVAIPELPPLNVLIDSAFNRSPQRILLEKQKEEGGINLSMQKRMWLQGLGLFSGYSYGKGGSISSAQGTSTGTTLPAVFSNSTSSQYSAGLSFGVSIGAIVDQKSRIKLLKIQNSKIDVELQSLKDEIAIKIFDEYSRLKLNLERLQDLSVALDSYHAQLVLAEKDFLNNRIKITELTAARESYSSSRLSLQQLRQDCLKSVFYFERITGINFHNSINQVEK